MSYISCIFYKIDEKDMCNLIYNIYIGFFFTGTFNELFDNVLKMGCQCATIKFKKKLYTVFCFFKIISL